MASLDTNGNESSRLDLLMKSLQF